MVTGKVKIHEMAISMATCQRTLENRKAEPTPTIEDISNNKNKRDIPNA